MAWGPAPVVGILYDRASMLDLNSTRGGDNRWGLLSRTAPILDNREYPTPWVAGSATPG